MEPPGPTGQHPNGLPGDSIEWCRTVAIERRSRTQDNVSDVLAKFEAIAGKRGILEGVDVPHDVDA